MESEIRRWRRWRIGEEAEPLLRDDEGDGDIGVGVEYEVAQVEHWVDVASAGVRQRHDVASHHITDDWVRLLCFTQLVKARCVKNLGAIQFYTEYFFVIEKLQI